MPVVIVVGAGAAVGCGASSYFDSATGCCVYRANAAPTYYAECREGPHKGNTCCPDDSDGRSEDTGGCPQAR